jgi:Holliday junction resolvase RusA-like endonuclease
MRPLEFHLDGLPPSLWQAYHVRRNGARILTEQARNWKEVTAWTIRASLGRGRHKPLSGPVSVKITFSLPGRQRWDLDNHHKLLLDAITESGLWNDDSQVVRLDSKLIRAERPSTDVTVRPLKPRGTTKRRNHRP